MIERTIIQQKLKEYKISKFIGDTLKRVGYSHTKFYKTPLGEKIVIYASRPGLVVGRRGQSIKELTNELKNRFNLENPQIEIGEIENINLNARVVAERIATALEQFGTQGFKGIGHRVLSDVINAGGLGVEVLISGKIPGARAKRWRFYSGYLKKCGDVALTQVDVAYAVAQLKTGTIGIQVRIMPPDIQLPDNVKIKENTEEETKDLESSKSKTEESTTADSGVDKLPDSEEKETAEKEQVKSTKKSKKKVVKKTEKSGKKPQEKSE